MAREAYIEIDGKRTPLTTIQMKALGIYDEDTMESKFNRVKEDDPFYYISYIGEVSENKETLHSTDNELYNIANYCTDKDLLQQRAYRETLNRLLWRFSMLNEGDKINYFDDSIAKYYIYYKIDSPMDPYRVHSSMYNTIEGVVYFYTENIAKRAIEEVLLPFLKDHPNMLWK